MADRIVVGDTVRVDFYSINFTLAHRAEVLGIPCATGDSWVFRDLDNGVVHYVSEGCTITKDGRDG